MWLKFARSDKLLEDRLLVVAPKSCLCTAVSGRSWPRTDFSILEFEDHYSVLMVVLELDDDLGPAARRLDPRELIVDTTPPETSEAKRLNALQELASSVSKFTQVLVFEPKATNFISMPRMYRGDPYYSQPASLRVHAQGKRRRM